jgi:hypothetical protein
MDNELYFISNEERAYFKVVEFNDFRILYDPSAEYSRDNISTPIYEESTGVLLFMASFVRCGVDASINYPNKERNRKRILEYIENNSKDRRYFNPTHGLL